MPFEGSLDGATYGFDFWKFGHEAKYEASTRRVIKRAFRTWAHIANPREQVPVVHSKRVNVDLDTQAGNIVPVSEAMVHEALRHARSLREQNGGVLDDSAILAVSETLGMPEEYVRTVVALDVQREKVSLAGKMRGTFMSLPPEMRRVVTAGLLASLYGLSGGLARVLESFSQVTNVSNHGPLFQVFGLLFLIMGVYNVGISKDARSAILAGAIFGALQFAVRSVIMGLFRYPVGDMDFAIIFGIMGGAFGFAAFTLIDKNRGRLGLKDAVQERKELLQQLVTIQEQLKSTEQMVTFMSVDIVGSTKMKEGADSLGVEYTFGEYHQFVEMVTTRYQGKIHSTAGDGITAAFDSPQHAFAAARNIQAGLIELNTHRNRIGKPLKLRIGIHTGKVMAPDATDITTVNFAHVIDVAAHAQKVCPVGAVAVTETAVAGLPGGSRMMSEHRLDVDGITAYVWQPKSSAGAAPLPAGLPPLPNAAN